MKALNYFNRLKVIFLLGFNSIRNSTFTFTFILEVEVCQLESERTLSCSVSLLDHIVCVVIDAEVHF